MVQVAHPRFRGPLERERIYRFLWFSNLMLSAYVEKINTLMRVGAVLDAVARMWDAEFLRRSTKPPAKIRVGSLVKGPGWG